MSGLTWFDAVLVAVVLISTLLAWVRGAVREMLTIAAWLGAGAIAWMTFIPVQGVAKETIETPWLADTAALVVVFVVPLVVLKVLAAVLAEQLPEGWIGHVDRSLGALFGLARGVLIVVAGWLGLSLLIETDRLPAGIVEARSLPYVQEGARLLERLLPEPAPSDERLARG
ncbi:MAG: CvpA family protein [Geminicoccaceae bacterium]|nr:CvpA family protein [Geminicoccaceae bacterium]